MRQHFAKHRANNTNRIAQLLAFIFIAGFVLIVLTYSFLGILDKKQGNLKYFPLEGRAAELVGRPAGGKITEEILAIENGSTDGNLTAFPDFDETGENKEVGIEVVENSTQISTEPTAATRLGSTLLTSGRDLSTLENNQKTDLEFNGNDTVWTTPFDIPSNHSEMTEQFETISTTDKNLSMKNYSETLSIVKSEEIENNATFSGEGILELQVNERNETIFESSMENQATEQQFSMQPTTQTEQTVENQLENVLTYLLHDEERFNKTSAMENKLASGSGDTVQMN